MLIADISWLSYIHKYLEYHVKCFHCILRVTYITKLSAVSLCNWWSRIIAYSLPNIISTIFYDVIGGRSENGDCIQKVINKMYNNVFGKILVILFGCKFDQSEVELYIILATLESSFYAGIRQS